MRTLVLSLIIGWGLVLPSAWACDACMCTFNARRSGGQQTAGGMLITPTAATLGKGHGSAAFLFEHQRFNSIPASNAHTLHHQGHDIHGKRHEEYYNMSLGYGLLEHADVFLTVPVVSKTSFEVHDHDALGRKGTATGVGDLKLVGKVRVWQEGADVALLFGVEAPTGTTAERKADGAKFEPEQQPGSGSWDGRVGVAVSRSVGDHVTAATAFQYIARGEGGQEHASGDLFHYNAGISYALKPFGSHPNASLVLELHSEWALRDHSREQDKVWDSGGTTILVSPGVSAELTEHLSAFWAMPIPVYQNLGGQHEELAYGVLAGLSWHF